MSQYAIIDDLAGARSGVENNWFRIGDGHAVMIESCPFCRSPFAGTGHYTEDKWRCQTFCTRCGARGPIRPTRKLSVLAWNDRS